MHLRATHAERYSDKHRPKEEACRHCNGVKTLSYCTGDTDERAPLQYLWATFLGGVRVEQRSGSPSDGAIGGSPDDWKIIDAWNDQVYFLLSINQ
jgi:hypothetical protein